MFFHILLGSHFGSLFKSFKFRILSFGSYKSHLNFDYIINLSKLMVSKSIKPDEQNYHFKEKPKN